MRHHNIILLVSDKHVIVNSELSAPRSLKLLLVQGMDVS